MSRSPSKISVRKGTSSRDGTPCSTVSQDTSRICTQDTGLYMAADRIPLVCTQETGLYSAADWKQVEYVHRILGCSAVDWKLVESAHRILYCTLLRTGN